MVRRNSVIIKSVTISLMLEIVPIIILKLNKYMTKLVILSELQSTIYLVYILKVNKGNYRSLM